VKEVQSETLQVEINYIKTSISELKKDNEKSFNELKELFKSMQNDFNVRITSLDKRISEVYEYYRVIKNDITSSQKEIAQLTARMTAVELEQSHMVTKVATYENGAKGVNTIWRIIISFVTGVLAITSLVGIVLTALGKITVNP